MGGLGLQDLLVFGLVAAALAWLTRRWWLRRRRGTCTCDGCPVAEKAMRDGPAPPPVVERGGPALVTIEEMHPRR